MFSGGYRIRPNIGVQVATPTPTLTASSAMLQHNWLLCVLKFWQTDTQSFLWKVRFVLRVHVKAPFFGDQCTGVRDWGSSGNIFSSPLQRLSSLIHQYTHKPLLFLKMGTWCSGCLGRNTQSNHLYRIMDSWGIWQTFALLKPAETTKASLLSVSRHPINKATCTTTPATYIHAIDLLSQQTEQSSQILTKLVSLMHIYVSILTFESI